MKTNSDTTTKLHIGFDVHKEQTSVAIAEPGSNGEVRSHGSVATTQIALERLVRRIAKSHNVGPPQLHVCYEAGGCGMWMARMFARMKVRCTVLAPSLIPSKAGDKIKTDKKDAVKLVRLLRAGELVAVHVPDETDEAKELVDGIMALKGFQLIAAMMVVSEVGDFVRFTHPKQLMSYLGLTPGEYSSAGKQNQSGITKCGNSHARWMLIECATHYRGQPKVSSALSKRQEGQPRWIREISWKAQNRLSAGSRNFSNVKVEARGK